jgi:hypothetical protein
MQLDRIKVSLSNERSSDLQHLIKLSKARHYGPGGVVQQSLHYLAATNMIQPHSIRPLNTFKWESTKDQTWNKLHAGIASL